MEGNAMISEYLSIHNSPVLSGTLSVVGAKNAVLVIMASLVLTRGTSILHNVPASNDVIQMIALLKSLGARIEFDRHHHKLTIDTAEIKKFQVSPDIMKKMRASVLVMGPLLAQFGKAEIALPGGCLIGQRPVDYHLKAFARMGAEIIENGSYVSAVASQLESTRIVLEYPSVGATENIMMAATSTGGVTTIINAALEPEVLDLIEVLKKMGAHIQIKPPATIEIAGGYELKPIEHTVLSDRLEAGALLLASAISGGSISIPNAPAYAMDLFLYKLEEMGHRIDVGHQGVGITLHAAQQPRAVSFKTGPYPGFPTDLQAPMMVAQCVAEGESVIEETVFENRLLHVRELQKMGAQIEVNHNKAIIKGVDELYGAGVIATDIRASCALVLAGLVAQGTTNMTGLHHWRRGYEALEIKLQKIGARIAVHEGEVKSTVNAKQPPTRTEV